MTDEQWKKQKGNTSGIQTTIESGGVKEVGHQEIGIEAISSRSDRQHPITHYQCEGCCEGFMDMPLCHHLLTLQHHKSNFLPAFEESKMQELEFLLTDTILQTNHLQNLNIHHCTRFSTSQGGSVTRFVPISLSVCPLWRILHLPRLGSFHLVPFSPTLLGALFY